jgi:hypothetical protein
MVSEYWTECMSSGCWNLISPNERHNYSETTIANSRKTTYYIDPMGGRTLCLTLFIPYILYAGLFIDKMTAKMAVHSVDSVPP